MTPPSTNRWADILSEFEFADGALIDVYVFETTTADWNQLLGSLTSSGMRTELTVKGMIVPIIPEAGQLLALQRIGDATAKLTVWAGHILLNCFFFAEEEIEFDFDPREVRDASDLSTLVAFLDVVGKSVGRPVWLALEGRPDKPFARYAPDQGALTLTA